MKFKSKILAIGKSALDFEEEKMLILFGERANSGLEDYSVIIQTPEKSVSIQVGDNFIISDFIFPITAVGEKASETFSSMGHCTLCFDGAGEARLPGSVHLCGPYPSLTADGDIAIAKGDKNTL